MGNRSLIASLVTLALGLAPAALQAAGLGRLVIQSSIGQPLAGEIELVSVGKAELSSLNARIPPVSVFESANIQYNSALVGARTTIERRANGQPYIRLTSTRPVDEPFLELLVELTWSTGRLVREYTALIDPPSAAITPAQAAAPAVAAPVSGSPAPTARPQPAPAPDSGQKSYGPVQPGDTLRKIAAGVRPQGVNLDQMLVGIFRSNPDAFINNNMNLLRTGKILRIPEAGELGKVGPAEATKEVQAQSADWNAYRQRVAGSVPDAASGEARSAAGTIATRVEDAGGAAKEPAKEVVKISKGLPGKEIAAADKGLQDRVRVLEEEVTAREKSLKDAGERIAALEKTINDMQRLLEIKGATPPATAGVAPDMAKPSVEPAQPETKGIDKPVADATTQPKPPVADVKPAPKPVAPPPPPAVAQWWEDPTVLGGGLLGLGALGGAAYLLARRRRETEDAAAAEPVVRRAPSVAAAPAAAAAASVASAATATAQMPAQASAAPAPQREDVDPIAEADVYIAYGRDAQAEEILKEALTKTPNRQEIKGKLLEIYAARKSKTEFNAMASQVHSATGGKGELWLRVAGLGFALDPDNALYAAGKDSAGMTPIGVQTDVNLDFDLDMVSAAGAPSTVTDLPVDPGSTTGQEVRTTILAPDTMAKLREEGAEQAASSQPSSTGAAGGAAAADSPAGTATDISIDVPPLTSEVSNVIDFEFDPTKTANLQAPSTATFEADKTAVMPPQGQDKAQDSDLQINLDSLDAKIPADAANDVPEAPATSEISFDFNVPAIDAPPTVAGAVPPTDAKLDVPEFKPADTAAMDFALDTVSFDLGSGQSRETPATAPAHDEHWYDVQTKFDLAKAYQEMGDKDGAREILAEVMKEGDEQQQAEAKELLAKLG